MSQHDVGWQLNGSAELRDASHLRKRICASCSKEMDTWGFSPIFACADCEVELCLACFVRKAEPAPHLKTHHYRIRSARPVLVEEGWAACDDLVMLDAIERVGLGNWTEIAQSVGRGHTAQSIERHYLGLYAGRFGVHIPPRVRQRDGEWVSTGDHPSGERYAAEFAERRRRRQAEMEALKGLPCDTSFRNKPPEREPPPPVGTPFESEVIPATMNEQQLEHHRASLPGADLLGYMPLRGDFDVEHENHAEQFVADMELRADDEPADRELKRQVLRWYNAKLDEREQRKRFVIDRGLLDYKRRRDFERRISPEQRRVEIRVRGFARFHSFNEHQSLVAGLVDMDRLAGQMMELKRQISLDLPSSTPPAISPPPAAAVHNQPTSSNARLSAYVTPRSLGPHSRGTNNMVSVNHLHAQQHARPQLPNTSPALLAAESGRKRLRITDETDLLSELERKLCDALQLPARKFLEVKEALSTGLFNGRGTAAAHIGTRAQIDIDKAAKLYDFARSAGWIMSRNRQGANGNA